MKVFISWSGPRSKQLAEALKVWLHDVIQSLECFYSDEDIRAGAQWNVVINSQLSDTSFGILCVTPENQSAPWLNFEAGALSKKIADDARVVPVTLGFDPAAISEGPLRQFNGIKADKEGFKKLVRSLDEVAGSKIDVDRTFARWWDELEAKIKAIPDSADEVAEPSVPKTDELLAEILGIVKGIARDQTRGYTGALPVGGPDLGTIARLSNELARRNAISSMTLSGNGSLSAGGALSALDNVAKAVDQLRDVERKSLRFAEMDAASEFDDEADPEQ